MGRREKMPVIPPDGTVALGAKIRARRWYQGLTLGQLASAIGNYDQSHLSHIENGRDTPSPELLENIGRALEITVEDLKAATAEEVQQWLDNRLQRDSAHPRTAGASRREAAAGRTAAPGIPAAPRSDSAHAARPPQAVHPTASEDNVPRQPLPVAETGQDGLQPTLTMRDTDAGPSAGPAAGTGAFPLAAGSVEEVHEGTMNETNVAPSAESTPVITAAVLGQVAGMLGTTPAELEGASEDELVAWLDDPALFAAERAAGRIPRSLRPNRDTSDDDAAIPAPASASVTVDDDTDRSGGEPTPLTPDVLAQVAAMLGATPEELEGASEAQLVAWLDDPDAFAAARADGMLPSAPQPLTTASAAPADGDTVSSAATDAADGTELSPELLAKVAEMLGTTPDLLVGASEEQLVIWLDDPDAFEALRAAGHLPVSQHPLVSAGRADSAVAALPGPLVTDVPAPTDDAPAAAPLAPAMLASIAPVLGVTVEELADVPADKVLAWLDDPDLFERDRRAVAPLAAANVAAAAVAAVPDGEETPSETLSPELLAVIARSLETTLEELEGIASATLLTWLDDPAAYHAYRNRSAPAAAVPPPLPAAATTPEPVASADDDDAIPFELLAAVAQVIGTTPEALVGATELQLMGWFSDPSTFPGPRVAAPAGVSREQDGSMSRPDAGPDPVGPDGAYEVFAAVRPVLPDNPLGFEDEYQLTNLSTAERFRLLREMTARDRLGDRPEVLNPLLERMREAEQYQDEGRPQGSPPARGSAAPPSGNAPRRGGLSSAPPPPPPRKPAPSKGKKGLLGAVGNWLGGLLGSPPSKGGP